MLGKHLTGIRNRVGLTVRQAQHLTGIPRRTLYAYESGAARPAPHRLGTLLDAYDATDEERLEALAYYTSSQGEPVATEEPSRDRAQPWAGNLAAGGR